MGPDIPLGTLNRFGLDYLDAGRSKAALEGIKENDSDGDGFSNDEELSAGRYPGMALSMPRIIFTDADETRAWLCRNPRSYKMIRGRLSFTPCV